MSTEYRLATDINPHLSISEYERKCMFGSSIIIEHLPKDLQQKAIIAEMKEVLTHIPDNKLAGYPEKLRKLADKLTKL